MDKFHDLFTSSAIMALFILIALIVVNIPHAFKKRFEQLDQKHTEEKRHPVLKNAIFLLLYNLVFVVPLGFFFEFEGATPKGFWNAAIFVSGLYAIVRLCVCFCVINSPNGPFKDAGTKESQLIPEDKVTTMMAFVLSIPAMIAGNAITGYLIIRFDSFLLGFALSLVVEQVFSICLATILTTLTFVGMRLFGGYDEKKREAYKQWRIAKMAAEISGAVMGGIYLTPRNYVHPPIDTEPSPDDAESPLSE